MKPSDLPLDQWTQLKRELMQQWHQLSESDMDHLTPNTSSVWSYLQRKRLLQNSESKSRAREILNRFKEFERLDEMSPFPSKERQISPKRSSPRDLPKRHKPLDR